MSADCDNILVWRKGVTEFTGVIFDIKEGAVHDGPGLRQTVFMKGCPLRCSWCHNPEGLSPFPQLVISPNGCTHCGKCMAVCPRVSDKPDTTRPEDCDACGICVKACPQRIRRVSGERITAAALAQQLMKNADYYAAAGGGVTFSGGEPLMQADFVLETLSLLPPGMHKAVETSGYGNEAAFRGFMDRFDLVMLDLKSMDDAVHRQYTGVSNHLIIENARALCKGSTPFIIRIPVIPGVNDKAGHFSAVAGLVSGAPALQGVELLPYHQTAGAKYAMMGQTYRPGFDTGRPVLIDQEVFAGHGIRSCVL